MNILKDNFDNTIRQTFGETIDALERAFIRFGIDYYLIGAFVRDVWTNHISSIPELRGTLDIDFAVLINRHSDYQELIDYLVKKEGFTSHPEPYRLISNNKKIVDLLPFGGIEKDGEVLIKGRRPLYLSVLGTKEVADNSKVIEGNFRVITLPGLSILKLIAWSENPGRTKDLDDFYFIAKYYSEIAADDLYKPENLELVEQCIEFRFAGARLLGREMALITQKSQSLYNIIVDVLNRLLKGFTHLEIDEMYNANKYDEFNLRLKLCSELLSEYKKLSG